MTKVKLTKVEMQKIVLSSIGFIALLYVYMNFFLGPLNRSRASMEKSIADLQSKLASSKMEITKTANLEKQATAAIDRFSALQALSPEGAPIAWFPPRMKAFFGNQAIDKATVRLDTSTPFKEAELAEWVKYVWQIDLPQTEFEPLGKAIAELENTEPLLSITRINIKASAEDPQFQQVALSTSTVMVKR